ncbi:MAG: hypothetical protein A2539_10175 [Elusimicrobia bacterium RIFOXYD2_FULL_34_15]|nr:MAG: hypothetical protein A2539_10175 [Elusimicrobia bacterium RIFOXYD2_FULL_34_15]
MFYMKIFGFRIIYLEILSSLVISFIFWSPLFDTPYRYLFGDFDLAISYFFTAKISLLHFHKFPFFSSYIGGGFPVWAHPQNMLISIPQLLSLLLNNQWFAIRISIVVLSIISMLGMFSLMRQLEINNFWCRLFGAIVYTFSGFLVSHLTVGHFVFQNLVYVPWLASAFLWSYKKDEFSYAIPVLLAIMVYAGLNVTSIFIIIISLSFLTFYNFKRFVLYVLLAILLSAPKLFFSYQLLSWFPRDLTMGYVSQSWLGTLHTLITSLVWPNQQWNNSPYKYTGSLEVREINCYIGILVLILTIFAIIKYKKHKYAKFSLSMLLVTGVALFLYPGKLNPFWSLLSKNFILGSLHMPSWFIGLFVLPFAYFSTIALSNISGIFKKKTNLIFIGICMFIFWDYFRISKPNLDYIQAFCPLRNKAYFNKKNYFEHNAGPEWSGFNKDNVGFEGDIMSTYLQDNKGVLRFYDSILGYDEFGFLRHSSVKNGRVDLFNSNPNIKIEWISPSSISVEILNVQKKNLVIPVNLNYFPGWKVAGDIPGVTLNKSWSPKKWGLLTVYTDDKFQSSMKQKILLKYSPNLKFYNKKESGITEQNKSLPVSAEAWYKKGEELYGSYDFANAVVAFDNAIKINPKFITAWESKGWALCKLKKNDEMIACFDKVSVLKKNNNEYKKTSAAIYDKKDYFTRATFYLYKNRYKEAIIDFDTAIKLDNNYIKAYYYRGAAYSLNKDSFKAIADFNRVIEFYPENAGVYFKRGDAYLQMKDYQNAVSDFNKCIEITPKFEKVHNSLGKVYYYQQKYDLAIKEYKRALKLNPDFAETHNNLGALLYDLKRYDEAKEEFREAIRINPDYSEAYFNRGNAYYGKRLYNLCISDWQKAADLGDKTARQNLKEFFNIIY